MHRVSQEDIDRGYFLIPNNVLDIKRIMPSHTNSFAGEENFQNYLYRDFVRGYQNASARMNFSDSFFYFEIQMQNLRFMEKMFRFDIEFVYRRRERHMYLLKPIEEYKGAILCIHCTTQLDPETNQSIWESDWLKQYATCLLGIQWRNKHVKI